MKLPFRQSAPALELRHPNAISLPKLGNSSFSAMYRARRLGGDFYDVLMADSSRLVFMLIDIAGKRGEALYIATSVQERFRQVTPELFRDRDINSCDAMSDLVIAVNGAIMAAAGGVRCAPAFIGCYDEAVGTLTYINAGHIPAAVKDHDGITTLSALGLPLGLFSHATYDAQVIILQPGAALVLVSKGLVESKAGSQEFGTQRVQEFLLSREFQTAQEICSGMLGSVQQFVEQHKGVFRQAAINDDVTTVALVRAAAEKAVAAALP